MIEMTGVLSSFFEILVNILAANKFPSKILEESMIAMLRSPEFNNDLTILRNVYPSLVDEVHQALLRASNLNKDL